MKKLLLFITIAFTLVTQAQVPTNGLLAYYNFESNANSHNGLFNLTNLHTSSTAVTYGPGGNGTGYAALLNNTGLKNTTLAAEITSEFTVAYWGAKNPITENNFATRFEMFSSAFHRKDTGSLYGYGISTTNGSYALSGLGGGTAGGGAGGWFHYAMCFKTVGTGKILEVYVNGVFNSSVSINNLNDIYKYNQVFSIGGGTNADGTANGSKYFNGAIDEFYVYNRALTVTEINAVKDAPDNSVVVNLPPSISNIAVVNSGTTASTINYTLGSNGAASTSVINYGTTASDLSSQIIGGTTTNASVLLPNLTIGTTYYYQIVATNSNGSTSSTIASFVQSAPADPALVAEYNFNNTYNNVDGGIPFGGVDSLTSFENDRNNANLGALRINATTSAAVIPGLPVGNAPRSVSIWVKKTAPATDAHIFRYGPLAVGSNNLVYGLSVQGDNLVNFGYANDLTAVGYGTTGQNWIHVVTTFDGTTAKIYHNGVERASGNKSAWNTQNTNFFLGGNNDISVDDLKIYSRVLTPAEVTQLYTNNVLLATENLNSQNLKATIYPNPTTDIFTIDIENDIKSVEIYSLQGQKILATNTKNVNVSNLSKGMYLVRIEDSNNAVASQKLIVK
jgi:hypothetical protein